MDFKDPSEVSSYFMDTKKPFSKGLKEEDDGMFLIEQIRKEMYRALIKGLKVNIQKEGDNINTGEGFKITMNWANNVAKMVEFRFDIDYDKTFIELVNPKQASRIKVNEFKYGQVITQTWEFKAIKDSLSEGQLMPGIYGMDGKTVMSSFGHKGEDEGVNLLSIKNIYYMFEPLDAMNFLFSLPAADVLDGTAEKLISEVIQPEDGPD